MLVVARDGYQQHYPELKIPLDGIFLDPRVGGHSAA